MTKHDAYIVVPEGAAGSYDLEPMPRPLQNRLLAYKTYKTGTVAVFNFVSSDLEGRSSLSALIVIDLSSSNANLYCK